MTNPRAEMNFFPLFLVCSFINATKRALENTDDNGGSFKRQRLFGATGGLILQAIKKNDPLAFDEAFEAEKDSLVSDNENFWPAFDYLATAVRNRLPLIICRMMQKPQFREAVTFLRLCDATEDPDTFYAFGEISVLDIAHEITILTVRLEDFNLALPKYIYCFSKLYDDHHDENFILTPEKADQILEAYGKEVQEFIPLRLCRPVKMSKPFPWQLAGNLSAAISPIWLDDGTWHSRFATHYY